MDELFTEEARTIALSWRAAETPRLWLNSALPNPNGWRGVGLTDRFVNAVSGLMPFRHGNAPEAEAPLPRTRRRE